MRIKKSSTIQRFSESVTKRHFRLPLSIGCGPVKQLEKHIGDETRETALKIPFAKDAESWSGWRFMPLAARFQVPSVSIHGTGLNMMSI